MWGAQTQRSLENFPIGDEKMPMQVIQALALVKRLQQVNYEMEKLDEGRSRLIRLAAEEIRNGKHDNEFPLSVWQTGSGTQTNMNVNEVIANQVRPGERAGICPSK
jgi:fumarate hydratase, class II